MQKRGRAFRHGHRVVDRRAEVRPGHAIHAGWNYGRPQTNSKRGAMRNRCGWGVAHSRAPLVAAPAARCIPWFQIFQRPLAANHPMSVPEKRSFSQRDLEFMRLALRLARRGYGTTSPNPMVGAVLVKGRRIIGQGWHQRAGKAHAEIEAIRHAESRRHSVIARRFTSRWSLVRRRDALRLARTRSNRLA